jgi:hypothetical protein
MNRLHRSIVITLVVAVVAAGGVVVTILWSTSTQGGVATAPAPAGPVVITDGCTVRALPLPASLPGPPQLVAAGAIDPTGRYIAGYANGWAVLWVDGKPRVLDKAPGSVAVAVNSSGVVVGWASGVQGWVYRGGRVNPLPKLPGPGAAGPTAINSRGDIVGSSGAQGVIWPADQPGQVRPIGDGYAKLAGISDDGLIVGTLHSDNAGHLWNRDGTVHPLPAGFPYHPHLVAGPWVLGRADALTGPVGYRNALWNVKTGAIISLAVNTTTVGFLANALGESGAVVGYFVDVVPGALSQRGRPAILRDGTVIILPPPQDHPDDAEAGSISADGHTIVGTNNTQALLWHC